MASDPAMDRAESLFLEALRCGLTGAPVPWTAPPEQSALRALAHLAEEQMLQPVIAQALSTCPAMADTPVLAAMKRRAKQLVQRQAVRTAEFLLLLRELDRRGLRPLVIKGAVCRSLYPEPEQRPSIDEDLLIQPEDAAAMESALLSCGLRFLKADGKADDADELTYVDQERDLYLELHLRPFVAGSFQSEEFNQMLAGAFSRRVPLRIYGERLDTLHPTDHLLYLLCHAYKHLLYGGVGVRQLCDICLFARRYAGEIDWTAFRRDCEELKLQTFAAAIFRIGERRLGIPGPLSFADLTPDESMLLQDCLTGGLYGANDPDRVHSSRLTLEAVAADRQGRKRKGLLQALFPPALALSGSFPYLNKHPFLLPAAWVQRLWRYARSGNKSPKQSLQIGRERVALLERYGLIADRREKKQKK